MKKLILLFTFLLASVNDSYAGIGGGQALPPGAVIQFAGASCPSGYLTIPTAATTQSRSIYGALFAAIGTAWGAGDGSTTFGMPFLLADQVPVQASGNVGTQTIGQVISHNHTVPVDTGGTTVASPYAPRSAQYASIFSQVTSNTGGPYNLAAGSRMLFCVKT